MFLLLKHELVMCSLDFKGIWKGCTALRTTGFLDLSTDQFFMRVYSVLIVQAYLIT
jgi:hypothetical protein